MVRSRVSGYKTQIMLTGRKAHKSEDFDWTSEYLLSTLVIIDNLKFI